MTPRERLDRYERKEIEGDAYHEHINKLIGLRVVKRAIEIIESNILPEDWNISEKEAKRIKHELITQMSNIVEKIKSATEEVVSEEQEKAQYEVSILSDMDINQMAEEKLQTYAGVHHFNEKKETEKLEGMAYDTIHRDVPE